MKIETKIKRENRKRLKTKTKKNLNQIAKNRKTLQRKRCSYTCSITASYANKQTYSTRAHCIRETCMMVFSQTV